VNNVIAGIGIIGYIRASKTSTKIDTFDWKSFLVEYKTRSEARLDGSEQGKKGCG